ncbi:adenylyltransferase/cytidyltransferase family protein [Pseudonocardia sp. RS11V-5]|uniref:adenylyltransferase/cytidyltransferase family protein n=1 Tax=Pseudonocardia terrae TaxID=2905831 RepID=UPI001E4EE33F|nr:adenylyltransferase/cytidyltransferase family protein [Pseudonocardia terrae]MCE3550627.1 adenylyltransferase/cytidyltransferase family protein [Pseudonocardia terrae]
MTVLLDPVRPDTGTRGYWRGVGEVPWWWGRSVVTLGVFDGLHRGHARLLDRAVELGRRRGLPVVLTTFDPHPATVAGPARDTTPVVTLDRRAELARARGADAVLVLPFDGEVARTPAVDFARDVLVRALRATDVVVGENFRFGHRGAGDVRLLRRLGARHGFAAHGVALLPGCSSTRVRELVAAGDLVGAGRVLGRPHRIPAVPDGPVLTVPDGIALPPDGPYRARVDGEPAAVAVQGRTLLVTRPAEGPVAVDLLERLA